MVKYYLFMKTIIIINESKNTEKMMDEFHKVQNERKLKIKEIYATSPRSKYLLSKKEENNKSRRGSKVIFQDFINNWGLSELSYLFYISA